MGSLTTFTFITLNGFYKGIDEDISWHRHGEEESRYSAESMQSESILLFGRTTYEMMNSFWSTPTAMQQFPEVAKGMNKAEKIVFSRSMGKADWNNTRLIKGNMIEEVKKLKKSGKDMTLLGSGTVLRQLAEHNLVDEYKIMIDPVALGEGHSIFQGLGVPLSLQLTHSKVFNSGTVLLFYKPA